MNVYTVTLVTLTAGALAATPLLASAATPSEAGSVFQCSTRDGRTVFSDEPCVGAPRVKVWAPKAGAQGIQRSAQAPGTPLARAATGGDTTRYDPYVDCQRRGGKYELAARICKLPDDAARHMFDAQ